MVGCKRLKAEWKVCSRTKYHPLTYGRSTLTFNLRIYPQSTGFRVTCLFPTAFQRLMAVLINKVAQNLLTLLSWADLRFQTKSPLAEEVGPCLTF